MYELGKQNCSVQKKLYQWWWTLNNATDSWKSKDGTYDMVSLHYTKWSERSIILCSAWNWDLYRQHVLERIWKPQLYRFTTILLHRLLYTLCCCNVRQQQKTQIRVSIKFMILNFLGQDDSDLFFAFPKLENMIVRRNRTLFQIPVPLWIAFHYLQYPVMFNCFLLCPFIVFHSCSLHVHHLLYYCHFPLLYFYKAVREQPENKNMFSWPGAASMLLRQSPRQLWHCSFSSDATMQPLLNYPLKSLKATCLLWFAEVLDW